ncbi:MAG: hypothetical protein AAF726_01235 [Planctomycetota bacterium]
MLATPRTIARLAPLLALAIPAAAQDLYATDFTTLDGWTVEVGSAVNSQFRWAADATPSSRCGGILSFRSAPASLNYNDGFVIGFEQGGPSFGTALSPPIDLAVATGPVTLEFWLGVDAEPTCGYDRLEMRILGPNDEVYDYACLDAAYRDFAARCDWHRRSFALDPSWGVIQIEFGFDIIDPFNNFLFSGPFIDDLRVFGGCEGSWERQCHSDYDSTHAELFVSGSTSVSANSFVLRGAGFSPNTFAMAFYGPRPTSSYYELVLPIASDTNIRCVAAAGALRLPIRSTHSNGAPVWAIDLTQPPNPSGLVLPGSTWFFQAIFRRDGEAFLSDGLRVNFCQ